MIYNSIQSSPLVNLWSKGHHEGLIHTAQILGSLHTQAKGCSHVIVKVQRPCKLFTLHNLLEFVLGLPLGGGHDANYSKTWNIMHNLPCRNPCWLFIHENLFGPLDFHLLVWSELGLDLLRPMRDLRTQWSRTFRLHDLKRPLATSTLLCLS